MNPLIALLLALFVMGVISIGVLLIVWYFLVSFYLPFTDDGSNTMFITYAVWQMSSVAGEGPGIILSSTIDASLEVVSFLRVNMVTLLLFGLVSVGAFLWLEYHDSAIKAYLVFRQCGTRPLVDNLLLPILNIVRILFNVGIQFVNFGASLIGFGEYGVPVILLECTASSFSLTQFFGYVGSFLRAVFDDFLTWIKDRPFVNDWSILNGLRAFARIFAAFIPALDCFCRALRFVWVYFATLVAMPSLHAALNFAWMTFINFFQIPLQVLVNAENRKPDFTKITVHACASVESAGTFIEEAVFLSLETLYGLITQTPKLPAGIGSALSIPYTSLITHPVCGLFKLVNMTFNVTLNIDTVFSSNCTGIKYFQFGHVFDEIEVALMVFGDFGDLLNNDTQALINSVLIAIKDAFAFLFEWGIGAVFYEICPGKLPASFELYNAPVNATPPLRFWRYYFVDYWFKAIPLNATFTVPGTPPRQFESPVKLGNYTYTSALFDFFDNLVRANQSLGNLIGLVNVVLGQTVKHFLNIIVGLVKFLANAFLYSFCLITFQCDGMPITARDTDLDYLLNESLFFAGAAGDLVRQFDNASCFGDPNAPGELNKTIICMTGNVITTSLDIVILVVREVVHFLQDTLTLPTKQVKTCLFETQNVTRRDCMRVPDLTTAITELDDALCDLSYAVMGLIPISAQLNCPFARTVNMSDPRRALDPPKPCSRVQTCLGYELCSIVRFIPIVLQILNTLFIRIKSGTFFASIQTFLEYAISQLVNQFATVVEQFALFLDCFVCALKKDSPPGGCESPLYDFIKPIGNALRELSRVLTDIFLKFVRVVLLFIVGFFSGNPVSALIQFIESIVEDVFLGFLSGIIDFVVQLLDSINLGFLGSFIRILYEGLCFTLQTIINIVIGIIRFFGSSQKKVNFCCGGGQCSPSGNTRKRGEPLNELLFDDDNKTVRVDIDNWLRLIEGQFVWQSSDACNLSIYAYKDIGWTSLGDYEKGETMFCFAKLMWRHRDDNQTPLGNSTCDALVLENADRDFKSLSLLEKREMMACIENRFFTEAIRSTLNITWLPQDLFTDSWRKYYFGLELLRGYLINYHFYNDRATLPVVILTAAYQEAWAKMGLNTSHYAALKTEEDVVAFKATSHLKTYFEANNATQYDATLYTVTGIWSIFDTLMTSIGNISLALNDNATDAGVYLSYNYTLENPMQESARGLLAVLAESIDLFAGMAKYWKDPANYKKRDEASESLSFLASEAYKEVWHQVGLMLREWRNESLLYNHTCETKEECDAVRELDNNNQSWVNQASQWWSQLDTFTTYPIANPRYKEYMVQPDDTPLRYFDEETGEEKNETRYERFWRYVALVRRGSPAAQYRWAFLTTMVERTRDKYYTRIMRAIYPHSVYTGTRHHALMLARHHEENAYRRPSRNQHDPMSRVVCLNGEFTTCVPEYNLRPFVVYEDDEAPPVENRIDMEAMRRLNPLTIPDNPAFGEAVYSMMEIPSSFVVPCINQISFPCRPPLECNGNATTTICDQCLYLQALIDRSIAAVTQLIAYYRQGGQFLCSLDKSIKFFDYTFDPNARVIVGDSPALQVGLFPRQGDGLWQTIVESARYMGDDTPNKLRLNDFYERAIEIIGARDINDADDIRNTDLFTRINPSGIHAAVFAVVSELFYNVFDFLYRAGRYLVRDATSSKGFDLFALIGKTLLICDWLEGHDLDGTVVRFSIGEVVLIQGSIILFSDAVFSLLFGFTPVSLFLGTATGAVIGGSLFLTLHANWAYLCAPGLNVRLADDTFYFIAYNLLPKCSWFWGFMVDSLYTNENCASCATAQQAVLTQCVYKVGFYDLTYNLFFMMRFFWPAAFLYLQRNTGLAAVFGQFAFINTRIAQYESLDLSDPFMWARFMGCNFFVTLPASLTIFFLFTLAAAGTLYPIVVGLQSILAWFYSLLAQLFIVVYLIAMDILTNPGFGPLQPATYQTTTTPSQQDDDDDSQQTFNQSSASLQRRIDALGIPRVKNIWAYFKDRYQDIHED